MTTEAFIQEKLALQGDICILVGNITKDHAARLLREPQATLSLDSYQALEQILKDGGIGDVSQSRLAKIRQHYNHVLSWYNADQGLRMVPEKKVSVTEGVYFQVTTNSDLIEGKGVNRFLANFSDKRVADSFAKGKGVGGYEAYVNGKRGNLVTFGGKTYVVGEEVQVINPEEVAASLRNSGLAKLTEEEKEALGLLKGK